MSDAAVTLAPVYAGPAEPGEPLYYAKNGAVWQRAQRLARDANGTSTIELGFPVCEMTEAAGNGAADIVAALMNGGRQTDELKQLLIEVRRYLWRRNVPGADAEAVVLLDKIGVALPLTPGAAA